MKRNPAKEIDNFFKEMGLEEEIKKIGDLFTDNFMIKGEETEDLKEALHRAPDSLLDMIWESINGEAPGEEISRQQKEESLYGDIPGCFESRFELLDITKINRLMQIMNYYPLDVVEAASAMSEFVPYGWVFSFVKDGSSSLVIMKEIQDIIRTLEKPEVKQRISVMNGIRFVVKTCLSLYGVCTLEQISNIFMNEVESEYEEEAIKGAEEIVQEYLPYLEEQGELWLDGKYIISPYLKTKKDYKKLLLRQNQDYYVPDIQMIESYGSGKMLVKNEEYKAVFRLLNKEIKDQEETEGMLEELSGYIIREDWEIPEIMNCIYDWNVVFSNGRMMERLVEALGRWLYSIRRWSEGGHSRQELHKENTDLQYITYTGRSQEVKEIEKKVYPNDSCPCGSGKKYKKCCGRK